jgi:hypothetical protein
MRLLLITVFISVSFIGCKNKDSVPSGILGRGKMQAVLWDVIQADAFTNIFVKKDSTKKLALEDAKLQKQIFELHGVTKEDFYNSYSYYKEHSDVMQIMLDSLISEKEAERRRQFAKLNIKPNLKPGVKPTIIPHPLKLNK